MLMFQPDDHMFTFDLKSGYHHVNIHEEHWKYLGFPWGESNIMHFVHSHLALLLHVICLPSYCGYWRSQRPWIVLYLDDGIAASGGECQAA